MPKASSALQLNFETTSRPASGTQLAIFVVGSDNCIVWASPVAVALLGEGSPSLAGLSVDAILGSEFSRQLMGLWDEWNQKADGQLKSLKFFRGSLWEVTCDCLAMAGEQWTLCWIERNAAGIFPGNDSQDAYLAAVVEASDDAIISKALSGIVTSWNSGAERIFGYSAQTMIGLPITVLFPDDRLHEEGLLMEQIIRGERVDHFETVRRRVDGALIDVSVTLSPILDGEGTVIGVSKIARDITNLRRAEALIWTQANYDELTRLPNRRLFSEQLDRELMRARRYQRHVAVLLIDLDRFKEVNDSLGHHAGDQLLIQASERIKSGLRAADSVTRLGGDEFAVMLPDLGEPAEAGVTARRLIEQLQLPFKVADQQVFISASIGMASFPDDAGATVDLLRFADLAMYQSKRLGRNQATYFTEGLHDLVQLRLSLTNQLRTALALGQFSLVYQPILDLRSGAVRKCEALIRWNLPGRGVISPADFIPLAEETGLIHGIGDWVFRQVAEQTAAWQRRFDIKFQMALNMSPVQITSGKDLCVRWLEKIRELGLPGDSLVVEITEGVMVDQSAITAEVLSDLRAAGIQISIDDFGTGFSSLSYLQKLDVNYLKIDQSFTRALKPGSRELAMCEAIVVMAHKLGLLVVAEGVESAEQKALLQDIQCDFGQGYLFSKPLSSKDFGAFLMAHPRDPLDTQSQHEQ